MNNKIIKKTPTNVGAFFVVRYKKPAGHPLLNRGFLDDEKAPGYADE